ncbi:hypothetical protein [Flavobacterium hercynium]|uniref:Uncharacterized protein n=1 Tax=Flavobacterium hercynium TaxID=387094 RepID=A0A226HLL5_9FLAO|nr:hypothetical protein [Flavobacterium hercynium]OXA94370.1 hypothetical protein B0A66_04755 [Flavobacterium hercynium]SMP29228.1 hypothetical protein SAMN06265346_11240 [Flavobacterium hercynium]
MIYEPYYTIEFSAAACYFEILINDIPVISMETTGQVSTNIPINYAIYKSGEQLITATIKAISGQQDLNSEAALRFNVRLMDVANNEFKHVNDFAETIFEKVGKDQKTPSLTIASAFVAEIPYTLTKWNDGENLNDVEKLGEKLIAQYNNLAELLESEKYSEFIDKIKTRERNMATSMYLSASESKDRIDSLIEEAKNGFKVMPLPADTTLKFYGYGKLVTLKKSNGEPAFYLFNKETKEELMLEQMFYVPKGKTELEII